MLEHDHWARWHQNYEDPRSSLSRRLELVERQVRAAIDAAPPGPIRLISMCAGQGRDVVAALIGHPRCGDVTARLVELDPGLVKQARTRAADAALLNVEVVEGDASLTAAYDGAVPAHVVLVCGVFGNISDADIHGRDRREGRSPSVAVGNTGWSRLKVWAQSTLMLENRFRCSIE